MLLFKKLEEFKFIRIVDLFRKYKAITLILLFNLMIGNETYLIVYKVKLLLLK